MGLATIVSHQKNETKHLIPSFNDIKFQNKLSSLFKRESQEAPTNAFGSFPFAAIERKQQFYPSSATAERKAQDANKPGTYLYIFIYSICYFLG